MNFSRTAILRPKALLTAAGLAALGLGGVQAYADVQTQDFVIPQQTTDFSQSFTFNQFDPALGKLNSVELLLNSSGNFNGAVTNTAASAQTFTITENNDITFTGPDNTAASTSLTASQKYTGLASGATATFGPYAPSASASAFVPVADFGAYTGTGTSKATLDFATLTGETIKGGGGNIVASVTTTAGGDAKLLYNYTPSAVPEPATTVPFALGGLALLGLIVRKTRRTSGTAI